MPLLLETIKIENGIAYNIDYHQVRLAQTQKSLWGIQEPILLKNILTDLPKEGLYRCRICYNTQFESIEYIPYKAKHIETLKMISSSIDYSHKYAKRETFNTLLEIHSDVNEILIEKEGYLTDTTIANIAFYDGKQWLTPSKPLLEGTMRAKLLDEGYIKPYAIKKSDLKNYTKVALMNAMIGFKILKKISISDTKGKIYDY